MKVAILGASGFVGNYLVKAALEKNHQVNVLIRRGSERKLMQRELVNIVSGDLFDNVALSSCIKDVDAVIYNIGIIRENPARDISYQRLHVDGVLEVIHQMKQHQVKRLILMSANGSKPDGTAYQRTKFAAEEVVKQSGLDWTIFQPSLIFGDPQNAPDEFCSNLRDQMIRPPIPAPLFYTGWLPFNKPYFSMSPVHVEDIAKLFIHSLDDKASYYQSYPVGGPDSFRWPELIRIIAAAAGYEKWLIPVPAAPIKWVASLLDRFPAFPITRDQLTMLLEGNVADSTELFTHYGIIPKPFSVENLHYLQIKR